MTEIFAVVILALVIGAAFWAKRESDRDKEIQEFERELIAFTEEDAPQ